MDHYSLLQTLEQFENSYEMLTYIQENQSFFSEDLFHLLREKLEMRWDMERMYGVNKKSSLSVIEKMLAEYQQEAISK